MVTVEDDEEEEEETLSSLTTAPRLSMVQPKRSDEKVCPSCFLLVRAVLRRVRWVTMIARLSAGDGTTHSPAQPTDVAEPMNLEEMARRGIADERGGERLLEVTPARAEQWFVEGYVTLVALIDDVPVGFLSMRTGEVSFIEGVFVHPAPARSDAAMRWLTKLATSPKNAAVAVSKRSHCQAIVKRKPYERAAIKAITVAVDLSDPSS